MTADLTDWITVSEVSRRLNKSRGWIHKLLAKGCFPNSHKAGGVILIPESDYQSYQSNRLEKLNGTTYI